MGSLSKLTLALGMLLAWSFVGMLVCSLSDLVPSVVTPFVDAVREPLIWSTLMGLCVAGPMAHIAGAVLLRSYRIWQPLRGGTLFCVIQGAGWSLLASGLLLVIVDLVGRMCKATPEQCSFRNLCITCEPVLLLCLAAITALGNGLLLASLHIYQPDQQASGLANKLPALLQRAPTPSGEASPYSVTNLPTATLAPVAHITILTRAEGILAAPKRLGALGVIAVAALSPVARAYAVGTAEPLVELVYRNGMLLVGLALILLLNRYPIILPASPQLDFFGRVNNLYQILAHLGVALKFLGVSSVQIYGAMDDQASGEQRSPSSHPTQPHPRVLFFRTHLPGASLPLDAPLSSLSHTPSFSPPLAATPPPFARLVRRSTR